MVKQYEIELDRNERDVGAFLRSRNVSLSQRDLKVLIAARSVDDTLSFFDTEKFKKSINALKNRRNMRSTIKRKVLSLRTMTE